MIKLIIFTWFNDFNTPIIFYWFSIVQNNGINVDLIYGALKIKIIKTIKKEKERKWREVEMREKSESELSKWKQSIKGGGEWRGRRRRIEEKGTDEVGIPIAAADSDSGLVGRGRTSSSPSFLPPLLCLSHLLLFTREF